MLFSKNNVFVFNFKFSFQLLLRRFLALGVDLGPGQARKAIRPIPPFTQPRLPAMNSVVRNFSFD